MKVVTPALSAHKQALFEINCADTVKLLQTSLQIEKCNKILEQKKSLNCPVNYFSDDFGCKAQVEKHDIPGQ